MGEVATKGRHRLEVRDRQCRTAELVLEIKFRRVCVRPPVAIQKQYPPLELTIIYAQERGMPKDRERIDWKLVTDLAVNSRPEANETLRWYALRWKIEVFHKILKSGCRVKESRLRTAERLERIIATWSILSWRILRMTMIYRTQPEVPPPTALTQLELELLNQLLPTGLQIRERILTSVTISSALPGSAAISPARVIPHPGISSYGASLPPHRPHPRLCPGQQNCG